MQINNYNEKMTIKHESALPSHYDREATNYDGFNEKNSIEINRYLEELLKKYSANKILDLTCGTGTQVFWLNDKGFDIIGYDINEKMLQIARKKAAKEKKKLSFNLGDMRKVTVGKFDAVLTIFNAIGHLTKDDFVLAIQNISNNLNLGGVYIFDIFNLNYLRYNDNITKLTIDNIIQYTNRVVREIQYSTINNEGILASYDIYHEQANNNSPIISNAFQSLQVYTSSQLKDILIENGFNILNQTDINGDTFFDKNTERILTIAKKII